MAHSTEAVDLVRLLATELAFFCSHEREGKRHPGRDMELCASSMTWARPCSPRCVRLNQALDLAARWVGCEIDDFYPQPKPKRRKAASAPQVLAHITEEMTS